MNKTVKEGMNSEGPNILILSGIHGNELTPIYATYNLATLHNWSSELSEFNFLTILGAVNNSGIESNTREINEKGTNDINRMFSSKRKFNYDELKEEIDKNDVIIDLHSSPCCTDFILLNQNLTTNSYVEFCKELNINYAIRYSNQETIKKYCIDNDKISFTIELNSTNFIDIESALIGANIVEKIINNINNLEIKLSDPKYSPLKALQTHYSGILLNDIPAGQIVNKNDQIGSVINIDTHESFPIRSPFNEKCRIICFSDSDYIHPGKEVCLVQPVE